MMSAYWKDIWRTISKGKKRFLSIALIAMLGVTMMCGLRAACQDLRYSADKFFDEHNLFDIRIYSTLGLTEDDVLALAGLDGVGTAEGGYNETVYTIVDDVRKSIDVRTLSTSHLNQPYLLEGRLPQRDDEIVITENYQLHTGKGPGDRILLDEASENLKTDEYIITGVMIDPMDINSSEGSMGFRSTATTDYVGYVTADAADYDIFTVVYMTVDGAKEINCYSDEYDEKIEYVIEQIEPKIRTQREQARYDEIYGEAMDEILEGEEKMNEEFAKADAEIEDAKEQLLDGQKELEEAREELEDGKAQLASGKAQLDAQAQTAKNEFANARNEIQSGYAELEAAEEQLEQAYDDLTQGQKELDAAKEELTAQEAAAKEQFAQAHQTIEENEAELEAGYAEYEEGKQQFDTLKNLIQPQIDAANELLANSSLTDEQKAQALATISLLQGEIDAAEAELAAGKAQLDEGRAQLDAGKAELAAQEMAAEKQFADAWALIDENQAQIDAGWEQYYAGKEQLESGKAQLADGEAELNRQEVSANAQIQAGYNEIASAQRELADGEAQLLEGEKELEDGQRELDENLKEYEEQKEKAIQEIEDAKAKLDEIDMTRWYVQDRYSLSGFSNLNGDADSIQAIGDVFPILFLVVAVLISLTTITRMVEEERGLIGTYKALGFTNGEIRRKYVIYAALACLLGGVLGNIGAYVILPAIIFIVFHVMYTIPEYFMRYELWFGLSGILLFEVGVLTATIIVCRNTLSKMPAKLMRPKSPKAGSRVILERIPFIWTNLSFLNKVTARNLFRYKKRLFMTIFGIAGCTGLLLCAFTIKDTVSEMLPQQYEVVYQYDMMTVTAEDDFEILQNKLDVDDEISTYISARVESVEVLNAGGVKETVQLIVVPDGRTLQPYIKLKDRDGHDYELGDGEVYITKNASRVLDLAIGDNISIQTLELELADAELTQIVENYFGNIVYMTASTYEDLFGSFAVNGALVKFSEKCEDPIAYTEEYKCIDEILSAVSTQSMEDDFDSAFALLNMVVTVVLVLAALLAFVVLFTLSNTNISERVRELATIKVLGFYDKEVHSYVNKETMILTCIGIVCGMPLGLALGRYVMGILELPSLEFYITLYPISYLYAALITLIFAFAVNFLTNKTLNNIDMVEALKSVE